MLIILTKSSITDVGLGSKYVSDIVQKIFMNFRHQPKFSNNYFAADYFRYLQPAKLSIIFHLHCRLVQQRTVCVSIMLTRCCVCTRLWYKWSHVCNKMLIGKRIMLSENKRGSFKGNSLRYISLTPRNKCLVYSLLQLCNVTSLYFFTSLLLQFVCLR